MCGELFSDQIKTWPQMKEGYDGLELARVREVICSGFKVKLQYNPNRIVSTGANTDPQAVKERKCFLCIENLPEPQKGILYRNEYLILCNPIPIFSKHFTISTIRHMQQDFESSAGTMFDLARDMGPDLTIFYNGPKCGASAPDHLHFQASPRRAIPVESDAVDLSRRKRFYYREHVAGFTLTNFGRAVIIIESTDKHRLLDFIHMMLNKWKDMFRSSEEPKMNVLCSFQEGLWRVIVFPRSKHRPEVYYRSGEERVLVSPAAVDIGGLIITPLEKDFLRIDSKFVEGIFDEVSEKQEVLDKLLEIMG
jgi:hypothetical protein